MIVWQVIFGETPARIKSHPKIEIRSSMCHIPLTPLAISEISQKLPGDGEFASDAAASDAGEELRLAPTAGEATTTAGHLAVWWLGWTVRSRHSHSYPAMKGSASRTMSRLCGFICHFSSVAIVAEWLLPGNPRLHWLKICWRMASWHGNVMTTGTISS